MAKGNQGIKWSSLIMGVLLLMLALARHFLSTCLHSGSFLVLLQDYLRLRVVVA